MGSLATGICIPTHKSKKRVFPGSSSSMGSNHKKNKMMLKQNQGVIELDSENGVSDSYNGKDYIDLSSDEDVSTEDMYAISQSHFDNIDLPTGMEACIPQFPDSVKMKNNMTSMKKVPAEAAKGPKTTAAGSRRRLLKSTMKVQSVKKPVKARQNKMSSGSVGSSSQLNQDSGNDDGVMRKYRNFKKFDIVEDYSDHYYSKSKSENMQPTRNWTKKIQEEWRILEKDLPDMIFVRVYESRMDLLRAVILGAEGTPYHDGLFFFDVCFPKNYPHDPPQVYYQSGGLRINPNLYANGKVCLSLLNTWTGAKNEQWTPGVSTMLQVLLSIQGLVLNAKPYFNEPGYERYSGSVGGENESLQYNASTLILSLKTMVYSMTKPPKHFEDLVIGHFRDRAHGILMTCKGYYTEGVRVGCGVDQGEETGSRRFKSDVEGYMKTLVGAFTQIGVKDVEEFVPPTATPQNLTQKIRAFFGI